MPRLVCLVLFALLALTVRPAAALAPVDIAKSSALGQIVAKGVLVVGLEMKYWPFEYADAQGAPLGYDVDIARLMAQELGVQVEFKDMEWTGLIPALQAGKVDLVISGMTATLERAKAVTFTEPYFVTGLTVLRGVKRGSDIRRADDLNAENRIIAVKTGTTGDLVAAKRFPKATINRFKDESACVREVVTGRADAFIYDQLSIARHQRENPETTQALLEPFTYEPFAIAIRKGDFDFWNWLNQFLNVVKNDGRLEELRQKHFGDILGR